MIKLTEHIDNYILATKKLNEEINLIVEGTIVKYENRACLVVSINSYGDLTVKFLTRWNGIRPAKFLYRRYDNSIQNSDIPKLHIFSQHEIDAGLDEWAKDDWPHASIVQLEAA